MDEYYKRLTEAFTDLAHDGSLQDLNEQYKVLEFENDLQNNYTIRYRIDTENEWDTLPVTKQTFNICYNLLSDNFSKFKSMTGGKSDYYSKNKTLHINSARTGRGGQGIFGGRGGFGGRAGRGCGVCGHGRGRESYYTHYCPPYANISINIEDHQHPKEEFRKLSP